MINVSWEDARVYASWLSQVTRKAYRLLSEAEWEYCCRAGTTTKYAFGDTINRQQAHFSAKQTAEAGRFSPNRWGLYDVHGNVGEWCEDNWHPDYKGAPEDGSVWVGGDEPLRVLRGGSWDIDAEGVRSTFRRRYLSTDRSGRFGFRIARTL